MKKHRCTDCGSSNTTQFTADELICSDCGNVFKPNREGETLAFIIMLATLLALFIGGIAYEFFHALLK